MTEKSEPPFPLPPGYDALGEARRLLRAAHAATLATLLPGGFPMATLTTVASDDDGSPILLASQLSTHTRNLDADGRCSLLLADIGKGDPLAHARLTVQGVATRVADPAVRTRVRARFLAHNPKAALYADFGDFSFWLVAVERAYLNGGFGKAAEFDGVDILERQESKT